VDERIAFRVANFETPLWSLPGLQPGRYNHPGSAATQYLALHRLPGTRNLVILDERVRVDCHLQPIDVTDLPLVLAAADGHAPDGLWSRVHHRGAAGPHPELVAWQNGEAYEPDQPAPVAGACT